MGRKMAKETVLAIYNAEGFYKEIAERFGTSISQVQRIKQHQTYRYETLRDIDTRPSGSKLTYRDIIYIYTCNLPVGDLATMFNVDTTTILNIINNDSHRDVTKSLVLGKHSKGRRGMLREDVVRDIYTGKISRADAAIKHNVFKHSYNRLMSGSIYKHITKNLIKGEYNMRKASTKAKIKTDTKTEAKRYNKGEVVYIGTAEFIVEFANDIGITITNNNQAVSIGYSSDLYKQLRVVSNEIPADKEPTLYDLVKVGDRVWHAMVGWCEVKRKSNNYIYLKYHSEEIKVTADGKHSDGAKTVIVFRTLEEYTAYHLDMLIDE